MPTHDLDLRLTTTVGRLKDVRPDELAPYTTVYIGDPYCELGIDNILVRENAVEEAAKILKGEGKEVLLSTDIAPWTDQVSRLGDVIARGVAAGIDGVEVSDLGVLRMVSRDFAGLPVVLGANVNLLNAATASFLREFNVTRLVPYAELPLAAIDIIRQRAPITIELPVHGMIPLGLTEVCVNRPGQDGPPGTCPATCYGGQVLRSDSGLGMRACGRTTAGTRDLCMLTHLAELLEKGYRDFRIEARFLTGFYRKVVGEQYRDHLAGAYATMQKLRELCPEGLCNGQYFEKPGLEFTP